MIMHVTMHPCKASDNSNCVFGFSKKLPVRYCECTTEMLITNTYLCNLYLCTWRDRCCEALNNQALCLLIPA